MKHLLLVSACILSATLTSGQVIIGTISNRTKKAPKTRSAVTPARLVSLAPGVAPAPPAALPAMPSETKLKILGEQAGNYIVSVKQLPSGTPTADVVTLQGAPGSEPLLLVARAAVDPGTNTESGDWSVTGGVLTFPFKYRPKNGTRGAIFEPTFSLTLAAGPNWKLPHTENSFLRLLLGIGTSSIKLTSKNTDPLANITESTDRPAAVFSGTLILETNGVQFAVSIGTDMNFDNSEDRWTYQGNRWFSAGIGFDIFKKSEE